MQEESQVVNLYLDDIIPNRFQPREVFDDRALRELAASIKEHGVIQPIIVRNIGGKYEIIAGERRYKASALAGLTKIPAIIRNLDDKESSKVALLENLQRRDLNALEEAKTYQKILELDEMTQEKLAKTMGKSQSAVANKLRLLTLSEEVQEALMKEQISERHARSLLNIQDPKKQAEMMKKVIASRMTVKELDSEIKMMNEQNKINEPIVEQEENKFINIDQTQTTDEEVNMSNVMDVDKIRMESKDIIPEEKPKADLDFLLKINPQEEKKEEAPVPSYRFVPSFEEPIIDSIEKDPKREVTFDNFTLNQEKPFIEEPIETLDIIEDSPKFVENLTPSQIIPSNKGASEIIDQSLNRNLVFDMNSAINKIREAVSVIEKNGLKIDSEEIDLDKEYQIVIKIDKDK